jgi:hypothetical protein
MSQISELLQITLKNSLHACLSECRCHQKASCFENGFLLQSHFVIRESARGLFSEKLQYCLHTWLTMIVLFLYGYFRQLISLAHLEIFSSTAVYCINYSSMLMWVILPLPIMCGTVTASLFYWDMI